MALALADPEVRRGRRPPARLVTGVEALVHGASLRDPLPQEADRDPFRARRSTAGV
jgi:hypothetical protein